MQKREFKMEKKERAARAKAEREQSDEQLRHPEKFGIEVGTTVVSGRFEKDWKTGDPLNTQVSEVNPASDAKPEVGTPEFEEVRQSFLEDMREAARRREKEDEDSGMARFNIFGPMTRKV